jgi:hypothetical protein
MVLSWSCHDGNISVESASLRLMVVCFWGIVLVDVCNGMCDSNGGKFGIN